MSSQVMFNAGAIETLLSSNQNQPLFKRANLGRFLNIDDIKATYRDVKTIPRRDIMRDAAAAPLKEGQNWHDAFVTLDDALEIVRRSRKPKAVGVIKWLARAGVQKLQDVLRGQRQALKVRDAAMAVLAGDLEDRDDEIVFLGDEIEDRDRQTAVLQERYVPKAQDPGKDNMVMIYRKHTTPDDDGFHHLPYYCARVQRLSIGGKRRWFKENYLNAEEIVVIGNPNSIYAFNRYEEEGHVERHRCHFGLIDLTRDDLYDLGVPALED